MTRRIALVTGASEGLGRATAVALGRDGFDVAVSELETARLAATVAEIEETGARAIPVALDLRDMARSARAVAQAVRCRSAETKRNAGADSARALRHAGRCGERRLLSRRRARRLHHRPDTGPGRRSNSVLKSGCCESAAAADAAASASDLGWRAASREP